MGIFGSMFKKKDVDKWKFLKDIEQVVKDVIRLSNERSLTEKSVAVLSESRLSKEAKSSVAALFLLTAPEGRNTLLPILSNNDPVIRGSAVYILGVASVNAPFIKTDLSDKKNNEITQRLKEISENDPEIDIREIAKKALGKTPEPVQVEEYEKYCELGSAYAQKQQWEEAVNAFQKAISLKPDFAKAHQLLALAYGALMDRDSALKHYRILKQLDTHLAQQLEQSTAFALLLKGNITIM